jgi:hypothetical protein
MLKGIKKKWLAALRSGKYKQGSGRLKRGPYHCCLGVLCEVADDKYFRDDKSKVDSLAFSCLPSRLFTANLGIPWRVVEDLWQMNDNELASFDQIADFIEKEL